MSRFGFVQDDRNGNSETNNVNNNNNSHDKIRRDELTVIRETKWVHMLKNWERKQPAPDKLRRRIYKGKFSFFFGKI